MGVVGGLAAGWLASAYSRINNSGGDWLAQSFASRANGPSVGGSVSSFLSRSASFANLLETSMQSRASSLNDIYARKALLRVQEENLKRLEASFKDLAEAQDSFASNPPQSVTTGSSATIDLDKGIMTMRDGTLIDIKTGLKLDPITKLPYSVGYAVKTKE